MPEKLFASIEGRILAIGLMLTALMLVAFGIGWLLHPDSVLAYTAMTSLNLFIGRAAGLAFGYASGFGHGQVIPFNMLVETIKVLVVFPLFVLSWRKLINLSALQPLVSRMHRAAESHGGIVERYGIAGLFVFVLVPFWMTGPVVGAIIGFLIGLRPWVNITVVLVSTNAAIAVWALLLNELSDWAATVNRFAPWALVLAIVLIGAAKYLLHWRQNRSSNTEKKELAE